MIFSKSTNLPQTSILGLILGVDSENRVEKSIWGQSRVQNLKKLKNWPGDRFWRPISKMLKSVAHAIFSWFWTLLIWTYYNCKKKFKKRSGSYPFYLFFNFFGSKNEKIAKKLNFSTRSLVDSNKVINQDCSGESQKQSPIRKSY